MDSEEFRAYLNVDLLTDMLFGAVWYRLLVEHAPLSDDFAVELAASVERPALNR